MYGGGGGGGGGVDIRDNYVNPNSSSDSQRSKRPEMKGPSADVSDMMSRLKTKTINIQPSAMSGNATSGSGDNSASSSALQNILSGMTGSDNQNLDSGAISLSSLGDIPADATPHKSKRRVRSDKNTVSLDL
jgi:hypothetical protein